MVYEDAEVHKSGDTLLDQALDVLLDTGSSPSTNFTAFPSNTTSSSALTSSRCWCYARLKSQILQASSDGKVGYAVGRGRWECELVMYTRDGALHHACPAFYCLKAISADEMLI
jgi:hypothetical protein